MQRKNKNHLIKFTCVALFALGFFSVESKQNSAREVSYVLPQEAHYYTDTVPLRRDSLQPDTLLRRVPAADSTLLRLDTLLQDTLLKRLPKDSSLSQRPPNPKSLSDSLPADSLLHDSLIKRRPAFLDDIIHGKNEDSLVYDAKANLVYIYNKGDISYQNLNVKADYIKWDLQSKMIQAHGVPDTAGLYTKTEFKEGETQYTMDSLVYNTATKKAKIRGVITKEGEGFLHGAQIKKVADDLINVAGGRYTTCDAEHPHFFMAMTKAQMVPGKKAIFGPSYLVVEDVPIYFLGLPFGFFPLMTSRNSGFIIPEIGEENIKGFYLRNGGYYYALNDYVDFTLLGGIYTLGSWQTSLNSTYKKRYKFSGNFSMEFAKDIMGEKGASDYMNMNNFRVSWTHTQDPKFRPSSSFSANVNFSSSTYNKYSADNLSDYLNSQTNSSIAYSKQWEGTPFSFSTNLQHSQNSQDTIVSLSLPNFVFNMSRIFPFRRKEAVGRQRWYEKISLNYTGTFQNSVTVKEDQLFKPEMFKKMRNGMRHDIPISTSFNLLKYLNFGPSFTYNERWYFQKIEKAWNPETKSVQPTDTTSGFYRLYNYSISGGLATTVYGMYTFGKKSPVQAIRHVVTPSISASYTPNFGASKYGFYKPIQTDSMGTVGYYSPFENGIYGVPGMGSSAALSFDLETSLEAKVKSKQDTSGLKKIKIIESLRISSSYNFLADSMNLSPFSISLRTTLFKNTGISVSATLDPYSVDANGRRYNRLMWRDGKIGRLSSVSTSFGYSFNSGKAGSEPSINNSANMPVGTAEQEGFFAQNNVNPQLKRQMLVSQYYDFAIPWNFGFNYNFTFTNTGIRKDVLQTLGFNGSVNLTDKFGVTFDGGYDFEAKKLTPGTFTLSRDLHCWQMSFSWVPIGFRKSWGFTIRAKSSLLQDLKYEKRSGYLDNLYGD